MSVQLSKFDNSWYRPGRGRPAQVLWFLAGLPVLRCPLLPWSRLRVWMLRLFGARIGNGVVVKPGVRVKFPWNLEVGADSWIGEDVWIDNLAPVYVGSDACISQGAYLCTGNHDWGDPAFGLIVRGITIGNGAWIGAKALLCPGVEVGECAVAVAGSVVMKNLVAFGIYAGNPAVKVKDRTVPRGTGIAP